MTSPLHVQKNAAPICSMNNNTTDLNQKNTHLTGITTRFMYSSHITNNGFVIKDTLVCFVIIIFSFLSGI